jgi:hypothetical protein
MKLIDHLPKLGGLPELLVFYCCACDELDSMDGRPALPFIAEDAAVRADSRTIAQQKP